MPFLISPVAEIAFDVTESLNRMPSTSLNFICIFHKLFVMPYYSRTLKTLTDYRDNLISSTYMCLRRSLMKHRYAALCFLKTFMSHDCITRGILFSNKHSSEHVVIIKMQHVYQASEQNMYRIM